MQSKNSKTQMHKNKLIEECKVNNKSAQFELYRLYSQEMYNMAMRLLRNTENAEDIIQECFLSAFTNIHQYRQEVPFSAWLKKIVINRCLKLLKKKKVEVVALNENDMLISLEEEDNWEIDESISIEEVRNTIDILPDKYRAVMMLYLIEGYDHGEISEILNISIVASRSQLMRGKSKLKKILKRNGYEARS